ncbi:hypothetical protein E5083_30790 [Streptomyces bauhiniae]|uniref:WXG100 family type VII secretion target n=1 Tax=Streptomyces bauhiniae TaxID=2340725 RepID=A0A4Z1CTI7_9ACTN|nr:hypothetical protein [Streptomyces bauhiniae]TGN72186.1 hypothetical protein E5083_30790 [Streptomyces bauhiniae]
MSFDEMWGHARTTAAARQHSSTQLNHVPADAGGDASGKKLVVTSSLLNNRAKNADSVRRDFTEADDSAMKDTREVGPSLKGFACGASFSTFMGRWREQMKYVQGLLEKDVAGSLRASAQDYAAREQKEKNRHASERVTLR